MILLTINFGFHVIAVFVFYKKFSDGSWIYSERFKVEIIISTVWHFYYSSVSVLVIVSGALLWKYVRKIEFVKVKFLFKIFLGKENRSICPQGH